MLNKLFLLLILILLAGCDSTIYTYKVTVFGPTGAIFEEYTIKDTKCMIIRYDDEVVLRNSFNERVVSYPPTYHVVLKREEELEKTK